MKSKRVYIEEYGIHNNTTELMRKLREKYKACKTLELIQTDENVNLSNIPRETQGIVSMKNLNTTINADKHIGIESDFSFSKSAKETKEETDIKRHTHKARNWSTEHREDNISELNIRTSSAKIIGAVKNTRGNFLSLNNKKSSKEKSSEDRNYATEYFPLQEEKDSTSYMFIKKTTANSNITTSIGNISNVFLPRSGEYPSKISFDADVVECDSYSNSHLDSCSSISQTLNNSSSGITDSQAEECICSKCDHGSECSSEVYSCSCCQEAEIGIPHLQKPTIMSTPYPLPITHPLVKLTLRSPNDYKDFGLTKNKDTAQSPSNTTHCLLPPSLKDNERYKQKLFNYLRKPEYKNHKTETCKLSGLRKHSQAFDGNITKLYDTLGMKRRKVNSMKKMYEAEHSFMDNRANKETIESKHSPQFFKFYTDKDIGFDEKWQKQLKQSEMDDDVETDEDQLKAADRHIGRELGEGIRFYLKNKKNVRNLSLLKIN